MRKSSVVKWVFHHPLIRGHSMMISLIWIKLHMVSIVLWQLILLPPTKLTSRTFIQQTRYHTTVTLTRVKVKSLQIVY